MSNFAISEYGLIKDFRFRSTQRSNPCSYVPYHRRVRVFYLKDMETFRVVCVNANARPAEFPAHLWVEKGEVYTVVDAKYLAKQHMAMGYKLAEIELPEDSKYKFFLANRFRPYTEDDALAEEAVAELLQEAEEFMTVEL